MYKEPTVFILGAGASWHYGYPTGEELIEKMISLASELAELTKNLQRESRVPKLLKESNLLGTLQKGLSPAERWSKFSQQLEELARRLRIVNPLMIDYFLKQNPALGEIGRFVISWIILECEHEFKKQGGNPNRRANYLNSPDQKMRLQAKELYVEKFKDSWCRFLLNGITRECDQSSDLLDNKFNVISFNYDVSIEDYIYSGLTEIEQFTMEDISSFFGNDRFLHVYGRVRDHTVPLQFFDRGKLHKLSNVSRSKNADNNIMKIYNDILPEFFNFMDFVFQSSQNIYTIDGPGKVNAAVIDRASEIISKAAHVYILGYGFDENNNQRLKLNRSLRSRHKKVSFTNFNDSNVINKRASLLLFGNITKFLPPTLAVQGEEGRYCEKSPQDVYQALEQDFFHLEER